VTGGAGFIGVHTVDALLARGDSVLVVDDLRHRSSRDLPPTADLLELDVCDERARSGIRAFRPDALVHLAAQGGVNRSWREPVTDARINVLGTVSMLGAAVAAGCSRVVFASSGGALYGAADHLPSAEETPPAPRSPYGTAKRAAEAYVAMFAASHDLTAWALRYGNVYGPGQDGTGEAGVVAITCHRLLGGMAPVIRGDGLQTRDFVFVGDVVRANLLALGRDGGGPLNIGTAIETSVVDVVTHLVRIAGSNRSAEFEPIPPGEVRRGCLDNERAARVLGWSPATAIADGLSETYRAFAAAMSPSGVERSSAQ